MVEQRPFKALVVGSSPTRPTLDARLGIARSASSPESFRGWFWVQVPANPDFTMPWVYILRGKSGRHYIGSTDNLERRLIEHQRGSNHTTRRLGGGVELVARKQMATIGEARALEMELKRKKNPQVAVFVLQSSA